MTVRLYTHHRVNGSLMRRVRHLSGTGVWAFRSPFEPVEDVAPFVASLAGKTALAFGMVEVFA